LEAVEVCIEEEEAMAEMPLEVLELELELYLDRKSRGSATMRRCIVLATHKTAGGEGHCCGVPKYSREFEEKLNSISLQISTEQWREGHDNNKKVKAKKVVLG